MSGAARKFLALIILAAVAAAFAVFFVISNWHDILNGRFLEGLFNVNQPVQAPQKAQKEDVVIKTEIAQNYEKPIATVTENVRSFDNKKVTDTEPIATPVVIESSSDITALPNASSTDFEQIVFDVPFTAQAPSAKWKEPMQNYGCEEAVSLMAVRWAENKTLTLPEAEEIIKDASQYEQEKYGEFHDTSAEDTLKRLIEDYFKFTKARLKYDIGISDIKNELKYNNIVIVPVNGKRLKNPYYTPPGPLHHAIIIRGFDDGAEEFITNDPGTRRGDGYRYSYERVAYALMDYPTGQDKNYAEPIRTAMIIISR